MWVIKQGNLKVQRKSEVGSVMIEAAVAFPLLFLLVSGVVNVGATIWETNVMLDASRSAARNIVFDCGGGSDTAVFDSVRRGNNSTNIAQSANWGGSSGGSTATWGPVTITLRQFQATNNMQFCRFCTMFPRFGISVQTPGFFALSGSACNGSPSYYSEIN